jgi:hypothetical protein
MIGLTGSREDQVVSYPDDPTALKKETALHKLSTLHTLRISHRTVACLTPRLQVQNRRAVIRSHPQAMCYHQEVSWRLLLYSNQADSRDIYYKDVQLFKTQPVVDKVS